jgi:hypothetical protein
MRKFYYSSSRKVFATSPAGEGFAKELQQAKGLLQSYGRKEYDTAPAGEGSAAELQQEKSLLQFLREKVLLQPP